MKRPLRSRLAAALVVPVAGLLALGSLTACTSSDASSPYFQFHSATKIGQLYPIKDRKQVQNFDGNLLSGGKTTIASLRGHVAVVNWWASWCGPCKIETPQYDALYRQLKTSGVRFLGIDYKDDESDARSFVTANDITYPILFDYPGASVIKLGNIAAGGPPFTMLLDKQHRVAAVYLARMSDADLRPAIDKLRAER